MKQWEITNRKPIFIQYNLKHRKHWDLKIKIFCVFIKQEIYQVHFEQHLLNFISSMI